MLTTNSFIYYDKGNFDNKILKNLKKYFAVSNLSVNFTPLKNNKKVFS